MKWLELAATDFDEALQRSAGVALVPKLCHMDRVHGKAYTK